MQNGNKFRNGQAAIVFVDQWSVFDFYCKPIIAPITEKEFWKTYQNTPLQPNKSGLHPENENNMATNLSAKCESVFKSKMILTSIDNNFSPTF